LRPPPIVPIACAGCGKAFKPTASRVKACSRECGYKHRAARFKALKAGQPTPPPPPPVSEPEALESTPFPEANGWRVPDPPAVSGRTGRDETILFIPDIHCGDHDERAVALMLGVVQHLQPDRIIQLGDALDFYALSRFDKNPLRFAARVQYELDVQAELYLRIRELAPRARLQQIEGNHEARGIVFLWKNPALADLRALQLPNLMRLGDLGWEPKIHKEIWLANGAFVVRHGTYIRRWGGYSAKAELDATLVSGISGHTHRQAVYPLSSHSGELIWCEAGSLQKNPPEWRISFQNWQQGVVIGEFERDGNSFALNPIRFRRSYKCRIGQVELSA
jgi:UDP-2,3-diacylglucosamine pyrophosphatase LpxH